MRQWFDVISYIDQIREIEFSYKDMKEAIAKASEMNKEGIPVFILQHEISDANKVTVILYDLYDVEPRFRQVIDDVPVPETKPKKKRKRKEHKKDYKF